MSISQAVYKRAIVAALAQLVTVGTSFSADEVEGAFALIGSPNSGVTADDSTEAVIRLFFHRASGRTSVAALLDKIVGTATSTHVISKVAGGRYLIATV